MIGKLLHIANSNPHAIDKTRFYAMKDRILRRFGAPDGWDTQHIPGKGCFGCGGSQSTPGDGQWWHGYSGDHGGTCERCWGSGWFKHPKWITLHRYRLGRFKFHIPGDASYRPPKDSGEKNRIEGYVEHRDYGYRKPELAAILLGLLFDWKLSCMGVANRANRLRVVRMVTRRCGTCSRRTWSSRDWQCHTCRSVAIAMRTDPDIPF